MISQLNEIIPFLEDDEVEDLLVASLFDKGDVVRVDRIPFSLKSMPDGNCKLNFRFYKSDLHKLKQLLGIPNIIRVRTTRVTGIEALCILLRRLAYPNGFVDLMPMFSRPRSELSRIFSMMVRFMMANWGHLLQGLEHPYVTQGTMTDFAEAIGREGSPYQRCIGFIDGTVRPICRPSSSQKLYYNGHKRTHAIKFQSVVFPDGLIASLYGPIEGRRHDAFILSQSGIIQTLRMRYFDIQGRPFHLYGDPAYPLLQHLMVPFKGHNLSRQERLCNSTMSSLRECVEWQFGKVISEFAFLDYKKNLKIMLQPVSRLYKVGVILTNCHTCIYGSQTADYFSLTPPTIEEYLVQY